MATVPYDPTDLTIPMMARSDPNSIETAVETSKSLLNLPTSLHLADGNGGEYRKSYHGFPSPVAYVIDSPQSVYCNPMFIDTWNRDKAPFCTVSVSRIGMCCYVLKLELAQASRCTVLDHELNAL